ncbi:hypothetical protein PanWU01x14_355990 [Parasponia andersonii]|uniref:ER membrane protein complex subunit 3 n=1 Tax=Parasponia andersonii TaxID=3476 RepID=A0A2P5A931_PARAD|nr:hypothetical protein PanWU01x14_355990 [Parasponia andersonii]
MLQNGIDLSTVDVSYVSSRSWYFLNLFGLRGLFSLILGEENAMDDTQRMMQMGGFGFDPTKIIRNTIMSNDRDTHKATTATATAAAAATATNNILRNLGAEKDSLDIIQHEWALPKFEHRAEVVLRKLVR